jgi:hypothetical protein
MAGKVARVADVDKVLNETHQVWMRVQGIRCFVQAVHIHASHASHLQIGRHSTMSCGVKDNQR